MLPDQKIPLDQKLPPDLPPIPGAWVHVKAGTFGMGEVSGDVCYAWQTRHQVTLTHGFEIQATETTQKQFREVMGYNLSAHMSCGGACPVERLSWHEAAAYCNALSAKVGLTPCYACTGSQQNVSCTTKTAAKGKAFYACPGYRLPTEAEWEVAYRAGTTGNYYLPGVLN
ncbi:MAG: SUMF1/EgtB/PvdO family nonheme iron enzyme, partial [Deltaproteobacteria bacterium]|nr:SUMF1/EgtB/PvdO family nonheme iron enzyme [Deltaproteobacteria bacterium]